MQRILDIDLDFFLDRILYCKDEPKGRPSSLCYTVDSTRKALHFARTQCLLAEKLPLPGAACIHHKEVFFQWQSLIRQNIIKTPFELIHVDAHADMGFGNTSCAYIAEELLAKPIQKRKAPLSGGSWAVNNCNFIAYALALGWIGKLTYVTHPEYIDDVQWVHMKDFSSHSGFVEMKRFPKNTMFRLKNSQQIKKIPFTPDPLIPMTITERSSFQLDQAADFLFVSQSPNYSPVTADSLYKKLCKFIKNQANE